MYAHHNKPTAWADLTDSNNNRGGAWISATTTNSFAFKLVLLPRPARGGGVLFSGDFFVSLSATLRENGWTDLHEIFRKGLE